MVASALQHPASLDPTSTGMPLQSTLASQGRGLCLLSLDAGGARGVSQLKILAELMHRLNFEVTDGQSLLPCDVFDMIGGSGSGGFIAILLVVLGLSAEQALNEFIELSITVLEKEGIDAPARTAALKTYIETLLSKYVIKKDAPLLDPQGCSNGCKLVVPISYKRNVGPTCMFRNFDVGQEEALNVTIAEAMKATLASPPLFTSVSIVKDSSTLEYTSASTSLSNPTRQIISEAYGAFGEESHVACLLSIGCGHPGIIKSPDGSDKITWIQFLEKLATDSEQKAAEIQSQMGHLGLYHRLSVARGLEREADIAGPETGDIIAHTAVYLTGFDVLRNMGLCAESLRVRDGVISMEQLKQSGGQCVLPPALPSLTKNFVMRREPWEFIEKAILGTGDANEQRVLVITGMGGCGKTQLILKFVHVHKDRFTTAFFFDGSSVPRIRADTIRHVRSLGVAHSQKGFEDCLLFLAQPCPGGPRLIVYDNVDDPDIDLAPLLPLGDSCTIVITSRNRSVGELSREAHLELDIMSLEEAVDLLLQRSGPVIGIDHRPHDEAAAIARALGCLPIALTQARSYMYQTQCSPGEYLRRLSNSRDKLLSQPVKYHRDMRYLSTYAAFDASFELLTPQCQHLLRLLSFVHWSDFPLELVILTGKHSFSDYRMRYRGQGEEYYIGRTMLKATFLYECQWDATNLDEMIVSLRNHSLVTLIPGAGTRLVQMHPVAHGWVKSCIPEQEKAKYQAGAILLLSLGSHMYYTPCVQYLASHITHLSAHWDKLHINTVEAFAHILQIGGSFEGALQMRERVVNELRSQVEPDSIDVANPAWSLALSYCSVGRYTDAELLLLKSLRIYRDRLGERHPDVIMISSNLALTYRDLGQLKKAESLQEEVLVLRKEILGEHHPDTLLGANNLAAIYRRSGRLEEARDLEEEVLKTRRRLLGDYHPDTIVSSSGLALIYRSLGQLKRAKVLQEEVLRTSKEVLGQRHPDTIMAFSNLAVTYSDLGQLTEAEGLQKEVLILRKEVLGENHPDTIMASSNLALTYYRLRRSKEAEPLQVQVLRRRKERLGEHHPDTITASSNLALTYCGLGRLKEAESLQEDALRVRKEILGELHPDTVLEMGNLAITYRSQGQLKKAETIQKEALKITKARLGERHPDTLLMSSNLAITYCGLGRLKEAESLQEDALRMRKEILGELHPDTVLEMGNLAITYRSQGQLKKAETIHKEALKITKARLGERHPYTLLMSSNLAITYRDLGRLQEAETIQEEVLKLRKEILGQYHPNTLSTSNNLAELYLLLGRIAKAETLQAQTLKQAQETLGKHHPITTFSMLTMAKIHESVDRRIDALMLVNAVEPIITKNGGPIGYQYEQCQKLRTRLQAPPEEPIPMATISPLTSH